MPAQAYLTLRGFVLMLHLLFNLWVVFGAIATRERPLAAWLHILSVLYGTVMENVAWPCPLTVMEKWLLAKAGVVPYQGGFLIHYLQAIVSPQIPIVILRLGAILVCLVNLWIYAHRYSRARRHA